MYLQKYTRQVDLVRWDNEDLRGQKSGASTQLGHYLTQFN